jgi:hypothetical protein
VWLNKERFDELARFLGEREALLDDKPAGEGRTTAEQLSKTAEAEGFKAEAIAAALAPKKEEEPKANKDVDGETTNVPTAPAATPSSPKPVEPTRNR